MTVARFGPDPLTVLAAARVVPVVVLDDAANAKALAAALGEGGIPCAEVTFRTEAAESAIANMSAIEGFLVGAGTIVSADQVDRAVAAGARFIVSPGFSERVVRRARQRGVPVIPGVATATEVQMARETGNTMLKFFPAEALGGVEMLGALAAPFPDVRFIPTGGVTATNLTSYLRHPAVTAVGGTWMVARELLLRGDWAEVKRLSSEATVHARGATA